MTQMYDSIQMNPLVGDIEGNAKRIIAHCERRLQDQPVDVMVFPELALSGYPPEDLLFRPALYRRVEQAIKSIMAAQLDCHIILGCPLQENQHRYNSAIVLHRDQWLATYHKQRLPNHTVFDEKRYFSPGPSPTVIDINGVSVGLLICEDMWHHDIVVASQQAGAELIIGLNASPFSVGKAKQRQQQLSMMAQEQQLPMLYCNMVGGQDELVFDGGSFALNAQGEVVQQSPFFC